MCTCVINKYKSRGNHVQFVTISTLLRTKLSNNVSKEVKFASQSEKYSVRCSLQADRYRPAVTRTKLL